MKKIITVLTLFLVLSIYSCDNQKAKQNTTTTKQKEIGDIELFASGFNGADGITIDNDNHMYVGNRGNNVISLVTPDGKVSQFVTVPCRELLLITTDESGNIYAAGRDTVYKITPDKKITLIADGFLCADDLRFDQNGNLYVTDSQANIVYKITSNNQKSIFIDNTIEGRIDNWFITGIAFDPTYENLYIVRMSRGEILKYPINEEGQAGEPIVIIDGLREPDHVDIAQDGNLYVTLFRTGDLLKIDASGNTEVIVDHTMVYATGIILGKGEFHDHYAYIADYHQNNVYKIYIGDYEDIA